MTIMGSAANITSRPRGKLEKKKSGVTGVRSCKLKEFRSSGVAGVQNVRSSGAMKEWSAGVLEY
jgi:hypothetical protein